MRKLKIFKCLVAASLFLCMTLGAPSCNEYRLAIKELRVVTLDVYSRIFKYNKHLQTPIVAAAAFGVNLINTEKDISADTMGMVFFVIAGYSERADPISRRRLHLSVLAILTSFEVPDSGEGLILPSTLRAYGVFFEAIVNAGAIMDAVNSKHSPLEYEV